MPKKKKKKGARATKARRGVRKSRTLFDTAVKTGIYALSTGNIPHALFNGAKDAYELLSDRYANASASTNDSSRPMSVGTVAVPNARSTVIKGSNAGVWANASSIEQTPDGLIITQRVWMGQVYGQVTTGYAYIDSSGGVDSTYIGPSVNSTVANACNPCFPILGGGSIDNKVDDLLKQSFLYPSSTLVTKLGASFEWWKCLSMKLDYVPTCPTTTQGDLCFAWNPSDIGEVIDSNLYAPMGLINDFGQMSQNPYFTSGPLWQSQSFGPVQPMKHGYENWLRCHFIRGGSGAIAQDASRTTQMSAGFIVMCLRDNTGSFTQTVPYGYVFATYTYAFKGQHTFANGSYGYGSTLPLTDQERKFKEYLEYERKRLSKMDTQHSRRLLGPSVLEQPPVINLDNQDPEVEFVELKRAKRVGRVVS